MTLLPALAVKLGWRLSKSRIRGLGFQGNLRRALVVDAAGSYHPMPAGCMIHCQAILYGVRVQVYSHASYMLILLQALLMRLCLPSFFLKRIIRNQKWTEREGAVHSLRVADFDSAQPPLKVNLAGCHWSVGPHQARNVETVQKHRHPNGVGMCLSH